LTRRLTGARRPIGTATPDSVCSSGALDVEAAHAGGQRRRISARLPTPENTTREAGRRPPARAEFAADTMSKPQPAWAKVCSTASDELAFIA
jgi:hypothetical protein